MKDLTGKKDKHDHKFSNLLKGCILAIVMLAPFFAILSKMIYVSVNKNAKDSYSGETQEIITTTYNYNNMTIGEKYQLIVNNQDTFTGTLTIVGEYITYKDYANNEYTLEGYKRMNFFSNREVSFTGHDTESAIYKTFGNLMEVTFYYLTYYNSQDFEGLENKFVHTEIPNYKYLDNVFYYAINQSKDEEILKWTKNTPIYNVINTMNTGLGLSANHILTYLLTYWSIILAIYIVFDIIIFVFTKITHYLQ